MASLELEESSKAAESGASVGACLQPTKQEVMNCAIPLWYKQFEPITFKSTFILLSKEFIQYLSADGFVLPHGFQASLSSRCSLPAIDVGRTHSSDFEEESIWSEEDGQFEEAPNFTALIQIINQAVADLGGAVLPKLNWSSPRDAVWMVPSNSLRCTCAAEVILLLKSSNFITHDLTTVMSQTPDQQTYHLCLRKWEEIHPSYEFRCFVQSNSLTGICQRNHTSCYQHLLEMKDTLRTEIINFDTKIKGKFPNANYVFDICKLKENGYKLVDFNPYSTMTDPLLFTWEELPSLGSHYLKSPTDVTSDPLPQNMTFNLPVFRLVDGQGIQPSDVQICRLPQDIIDLTTGEDIHKFVDLFIKGNLPGQDSDSD